MTGNPKASGSGSGVVAELEAIESGVIDHLFALQPSYAVFLGLHQYDGRMPDLTTAATSRWAVGAKTWLEKLRALDLGGLEPGRRLDVTLLELLLESPLFDLEDAHELERNPMAYVGPISLTAFMIRDYAPVAPRVDAMVQVVQAVPALLEHGRQRLNPRVPGPFVRLALAMGSGLGSHFEEAEEFARRCSPSLGDRFHAARVPAEAAVNEYLDRMKSDFLPHATDDFALGAERYQRLLWVREGIRTPFSEILAAGRADLERNQRRLHEIAAKAYPTHPVGEAVEQLLEALYRRHRTADQLVPHAQELVETTRKFVEEHHLVTIPEPAVCRVEETPVYGRALSTASMNPPGPFDVAGDEGIYFVTPVDSTWAPERQEEWLRSLNDAMLRNITVHEVYPGHYLQFLHFRRGAGSYARKVYLSSSFAEGWAHYCEQLAIEAGMGRASSDAEVAQLHDALLRDCRLIASVGLHTQGWTLSQATELLRKEAHFEQLPAEREAIRGTFNPEYFCYTLGKLEILRVRERHLQHRFRGSLQAFHDQLLGFGCPPIGMLDTLLGAG